MILTYSKGFSVFAMATVLSTGFAQQSGLEMVTDQAGLAENSVYVAPNGNNILGGVFHSREDVEDFILDKWSQKVPSTGPGSSVEELAILLTTVSEVKLFHASTADNVSDVLSRLGAIRVNLVAKNEKSLQAQSTTAASGGSTQRIVFQDPNVGNQDLVFVPITPCRIFDTRSDLRGKMINNETRTFHTQSNSTPQAFDDQGGDASGCPEIDVLDPPAVAINVTVTQAEEPGGFVTVWPEDETRPFASTLNIQGLQSVPNSTIISTCYLCGPDIQAFTTAPSHLIGDVVGFFVEKDKTLNLLPAVGGTASQSSAGANFGKAFPDGTNASYYTQRTLPGDYTPGTPLTLVEMFISSTASCDILWRVNGPSPLGFTPGESGYSIAGGSDVTLNTPSIANQVFFRTVSYDSDSATVIDSHDTIQVSNFRSGGATADTCSGTLTLKGAYFVYE